MEQNKRQSQLTPGQLLVRGLAVGFVANQVLDVFGSLIYETEDETERLKEDTVRGGHQAYEVAVTKIAALFGKELTEEEIKYYGWKFHRSFGISGGIQYMALRDKYPELSKGLGIGYGLSFYIIADQILIYALGLTPGPQKFNWRPHLRGAVAHIAYGIAAELTAKSFDVIDSYETQRGPALWEDQGRRQKVSKSQMQLANA